MYGLVRPNPNLFWVDVEMLLRLPLAGARKIGDLLALFVGQRLCINFYVSRAKFLTTLCSHLDITCTCYFWSNLFKMDDESLHTLNN